MKSNIVEIVTGVAIGTVVGYFLDPERARRGAAIMDLGSRAMHIVSAPEAIGHKGKEADRELAHAVYEALRDFVNGNSGSGLRRPAFPCAIAALAQDGRVTLIGSVAAPDLPLVMATVEGVPGVRDIENRLHLLAAAAGRRTPSAGNDPDLRWRLGLGTLGGGLLGFAVTQKGIKAVLTAAAGATAFGHGLAYSRQLKPQ